jgi:8-hydroxy-5-deazaflavin:NADPH oxidoreductase
MRVGIVGAGRIGGHVGIQLGRSGHEVLFSYSRDPAKLEQLAADAQGARAGTPREAVEFGEAVVVAVPWRLIDDVLSQTGSLDGKVVVDTTNQFGSGGLEELPDGLSAVETNARRMPGALLAKAFNTLTAGYQRDVAEGRVDGDVAMFFAAREQAAIDAAATLIEGCGFVPVHLGGWERVRLLEAPRRPGSVYGEAYRPEDGRRIAAAPLDEAARLANELKIEND